MGDRARVIGGEECRESGRASTWEVGTGTLEYRRVRC